MAGGWFSHHLISRRGMRKTRKQERREKRWKRELQEANLSRPGPGDADSLHKSFLYFSEILRARAIMRAELVTKLHCQMYYNVRFCCINVRMLFQMDLNNFISCFSFLICKAHNNHQAHLITEMNINRWIHCFVDFAHVNLNSCIVQFILQQLSKDWTRAPRSM